MRHVNGRKHLTKQDCKGGTCWYTTGSIWNFRVLAMAKCEDGVIRTIRLNQQPDTAFSHPGRTSIQRKSVRGFVSSDDGTLKFTAYKGED